MPGSSLWLLPPAKLPLTPLLTSLIAKTGDRFHSPHTFLPHVTLTSDISSKLYGDDPQAWLKKLAEKFPPASDVSVRFEKLEVGTIFFKKVTIRVEKKKGLRELAKVARGNVEEDEACVEKWVEQQYLPHLSLLYSASDISDEELKEIEQVVGDAGVSLEGKEEVGGFVGGQVVLVPTEKKVEEWVPIAVVDL